MKHGRLDFTPVEKSLQLVADPVRSFLRNHGSEDVFVAQIDPELADTAAFCEKYEVGLDISANCVVVRAKRADRVWYVALMIMATDRADVNKKVKKHIHARKLSFAPMDEAVELTGMEYGGITPLGLPEGWSIIVDTKVAESEEIIIGSGIRGSKIATSGALLANLPKAEVLDIKQ